MSEPGQVAICEVSSHEGEEVRLRGWLYNKRSSGKLHFLQLRDGTGIIQCVVFKGDVPEEVFRRADHLPQESSIVVTGSVREDKRSVIGWLAGIQRRWACAWQDWSSEMMPEMPIPRHE